MSRKRAALAACGLLLAGSCSVALDPPYIDIRDADKVTIAGRIVDGRQVTLTGRHVERENYNNHWYSNVPWNGRGAIMVETEQCGRIPFYVVDSRHASCGNSCAPWVRPKKDCPLSDEATVEQWSVAQFRIIE